MDILNCHHLFHYANPLKQKSLKLIAPSHKEIKYASQNSEYQSSYPRRKDSTSDLRGPQRIFRPFNQVNSSFRWVLTETETPRAGNVAKEIHLCSGHR